MYPKEFQDMVRELLKNPAIPVGEIAREMDCSLDLIYRLNNRFKIRTMRKRRMDGIKASGILGEALTYLAEAHGKVQSQSFASDVEETTLTRLRGGNSSCTLTTLERIVAAAGYRLTLERIEDE